MKMSDPNVKKVNCCFVFVEFRINHFTPFQVEEYKTQLITKAEDLILKGFPEKILQLNELLETPMFCNRDFDEVYQVKQHPDDNTKQYSTITMLFLAGPRHSRPGSGAGEQ